MPPKDSISNIISKTLEQFLDRHNVAKKTDPSIYARKFTRTVRQEDLRTIDELTMAFRFLQFLWKEGIAVYFKHSCETMGSADKKNDLTMQHFLQFVNEVTNLLKSIKREVFIKIEMLQRGHDTHSDPVQKKYGDECTFFQNMVDSHRKPVEKENNTLTECISLASAVYHTAVYFSFLLLDTDLLSDSLSTLTSESNHWLRCGEDTTVNDAALSFFLMDKENGTAVREEWLTLIFCITYKIISKDYSNLYRWMQKYEDEWQHHCDNKNSTDEEKSFWRIAQLFVHFSVVEDYTAIQPLFSFHTEKNENGVWWQCALLLFYRVLLERVIRHSFVERPTGNVFRPIVQTEANSRKLTFSDIVNLNNNNNEKENSALEFYLGPHLWKRLDHNDPSDASGRCGMLLLRSQMVVLCLEGGPWPVPPRVLLSISA